MHLCFSKARGSCWREKMYGKMARESFAFGLLYFHWESLRYFSLSSSSSLPMERKEASCAEGVLPPQGFHT